MPIAKRYELLAWVAQKAERYIVEDDYDSEFRFVGQPIPALKSIDMLGRVIYMNTFLKRSLQLYELPIWFCHQNY